MITTSGPPHSDIDVTTTEDKASEPITKNKESDAKQSIDYNSNSYCV